MLTRAGLATLLLAVSGCVIGAPPGFSSGDSWSFPLVAPFEDSELYAPVKINGKGPFLFKIDPDSPISSVDAGIRSMLDLYTVRAPDAVDERDRRVPVVLAEVNTIQVGNLTVRSRKLRVHNLGTYWIGGRKVRGLLGRDVIADSLVFAADRDRGMGYIAKQGKLLPPADAVKIGYSQTFGRRISTVTVNDKQLTMHLDLGGHTNTLWPKKMDQVGLKAVPLSAVQVDELGTKHASSVAGLAQTVQLGSEVQHGQMFLPYTDKRIREKDVDGTIGLNFLSKYNIVANWHKRTLWLQKRSADAGKHLDERLRRFGGVFDGCKNAACVSFQVLGKKPPEPPPATATTDAPTTDAPTTDAPTTDAPTADAPTADAAGAPAQPVAPQPPAIIPAPPLPPVPPSLEITVERNDLPTFEILIEALDASGRPVGTRLVATLQKGATKLVEKNIDATLRDAASFRVIDLSPFPRECQKYGNNLRCVWPLVSRH